MVEATFELPSSQTVQVRRNFIRKVYGILFVQLLVTMGLITPFIFHEGLRQFVLANRWLMWAAFGVTFVCLIAMSCCESVRRNTPTNYIFLGVFTLCEGFMMGTISAAYQRNEVMLAVGICAGVSLALTLFAFQTKYDFTTCGGKDSDSPFSMSFCWNHTVRVQYSLPHTLCIQYLLSHPCTQREYSLSRTVHIQYSLSHPAHIESTHCLTLYT